MPSSARTHTWSHEIHLWYHFSINVPSSNNPEPKTTIDAVHRNAKSYLLSRTRRNLLRLNLLKCITINITYTFHPLNFLSMLFWIRLTLETLAGEGGSGDTKGLFWNPISISSTDLWISAISSSALCSCSSVSPWPFSFRLSHWTCLSIWGGTWSMFSWKWFGCSSCGFLMTISLLLMFYMARKIIICMQQHCGFMYALTLTFTAVESPYMILLKALRSSCGPL